MRHPHFQCEPAHPHESPIHAQASQKENRHPEWTSEPNAMKRTPIEMSEPLQFETTKTCERAQYDEEPKFGEACEPFCLESPL